MNKNLFHKKNEFRKRQLAIRKKLFLNINNVFDKNLFDELFKKINFDTFNVISSFVSVNSEINTTKLNKYILEKKKILCMPIIFEKNQYLKFRKFTGYDDMIDGFMKIKEPPETNVILIPEILFVPCLAYDSNGFRLGYGGGYYDKTFEYLNKIKRNFISVGYAFDDQKVNDLPKDKFDIKLDYVITEKKIYSFV